MSFNVRCWVCPQQRKTVGLCVAKLGARWSLIIRSRHHSFSQPLDDGPGLVFILQHVEGGPIDRVPDLFLGVCEWRHRKREDSNRWQLAIARTDRLLLHVNVVALVSVAATSIATENQDSLLINLERAGSLPTYHLDQRRWTIQFELLPSLHDILVQQCEV